VAKTLNDGNRLMLPDASSAKRMQTYRPAIQK